MEKEEMDPVLCFPSTLKRNRTLMQLMAAHHFHPVVESDNDFVELREQGFKFGLFDLSRVEDEHEISKGVECFPQFINTVLVGSSMEAIQRFFPDLGSHHDPICPPFENEDIIHGLTRCRNRHLVEHDLETFKNELDEKHRMLKVYRGLTRTLTSTLNLKQLLHKVKEKNSGLLQCATLSLYLFNNQTSQLDYMKTQKKDTFGPTQKHFEIGQGVPGLVFESGKKLLANHPFDPDIQTALDKQYSYPLHSMCCIPLKFRERYLGVVQAVNKNDGAPFEAIDLVILQILADHTAIAVENSVLFEKVRKLTIIDDLTQVYNFRFFNIMLANEFKRAKRFLSPLSLLFLDLDGFKRVNDRYGHMTGSMVLREIATMIKNTVRKCDVVARFGGDEFTVILPNTGMDGAQRVARRIQQRMEAFRYPLASWTIKLSASIGISSFPEHVKTRDELLKVADKAMYKIKENQKREVSIGMLSHEDIQKLALTQKKRTSVHEDA